MCPTRELVVQNLEVLRKMAKYTKITACSTADEEGGPPRRDPIRDQVGRGAQVQEQSCLTFMLHFALGCVWYF